MARSARDRREVQRGEWEHRILVVVETGQQLLGLFEASLSHDEGRPAGTVRVCPDGDPLGKQVERADELVFGVRPSVRRRRGCPRSAPGSARRPRGGCRVA